MPFKYDKILSKGRENDGATLGGSTDINGLLYGNGSVLSAVQIGTVAGTVAAGDDARIVGAVQAGGAGSVTVLADVTLDAIYLPTYHCNADASTDVVTFTGRSPTNGEAYYLEAGTGSLPTGLAANAFVNEFIGPVVYAVSASGTTCKFSLTRSGAAIDITDAGTAGWTARLASINSFNISGLSITNGQEFEVIAQFGEGWATGAASNRDLAFRINSDITAGRHRYANTESTAFVFNKSANIVTYSYMRASVSDLWLNGFALARGVWGTDTSGANSTAVNYAPSVVSYSNGSVLTVTSIDYYGAGVSDFKLGARFIVRRIG